MKSGRAVVGCLIALGLSALPTSAQAAGVDTPVRVIGIVEQGASPRAAASRVAKLTGGRVLHVYEHALRGFAVEGRAGLIDRLNLSKLKITSLYEDADIIVRRAIDPIVGDFTEAHRKQQYVPEGIRRIGADRSSTRSGDGAGSVDVDIAIMDTGIEADHPDLNVVGGVDCTGGTIPPHQQLLGKPAWSDTNGHGTHVAGTVGARDNGFGVVGIAPGARLWAVKAFEETQELPGTDEDTWTTGVGPVQLPEVPHLTLQYLRTNMTSLLCGLNWTALHSETIDVLNMSLEWANNKSRCDGRPRPNKTYWIRDNKFPLDVENEAVCAVVRRGVIAVAASGNSGLRTASTPARLDEVIGVSGLADHDGKTGGLAPAKDTCPDYSMTYTTRYRYLPKPVFEFGEKLMFGVSDAEHRRQAGLHASDDSAVKWSNKGKEIDLIAPATCVLSTFYRGKYARNDGTSMASPHVAGAAALYVSRNPDATPAQVRAALIAAGTYDYDDKHDTDGVKEPLLNVSSF